MTAVEALLCLETFLQCGVFGLWEDRSSCAACGLGLGWEAHMEVVSGNPALSTSCSNSDRGGCDACRLGLGGTHGSRGTAAAIERGMHSAGGES
eukprot:1140289-Pelagomonas_calceolata.AAC.3